MGRLVQMRSFLWGLGLESLLKHCSICTATFQTNAPDLNHP